MSNPFRITKPYIAVLRQKLEVFRQVTGTKYGLLMTMVSQEGTADNPYRNEIVDSEVILETFFY